MRTFRTLIFVWPCLLFSIAAAAQVPPSVTATISTPTTSVCAGTNVTFTASLSTGDWLPTAYEWEVNGRAVAGATGSTWSTTSLPNGARVVCIISAILLHGDLPFTRTSNTIVMTVNPSKQLNVVLYGGEPLCPGVTDYFLAVVADGTTVLTNETPAQNHLIFQWKKNGVNVTSDVAVPNPDLFESKILKNGDVINFVVTEPVGCYVPNTATSNSITAQIIQPEAYALVLNTTQGTNLCQNQNVTFNAVQTPALYGTTYVWYQNGSPIRGATGSSYTTTASSVAHLQGISVRSSLTNQCGAVSFAVETAANMPFVINPVVTPSVSISVSPGTTVCSSTAVTFTANPVNGGSAPSYQWQINNGNVNGATGRTFTTTGLGNGQQVRCIMRSNGPCLSTPTAISNTIRMTVTPSQTMGVLVSGPRQICQGAQALYLALVVNPAPTISYQWTKNGAPVGGNSLLYAATNLNNGDVLRCAVSTTTACWNTPALSDLIPITVIPTRSMTATISGPASLCPGQLAEFTVNVAGGSGTLTYQWQKNGVNISSIFPFFPSTLLLTTGLKTGDVITCVVTTNGACYGQPTVTSNPIRVTVGAPAFSLALSVNQGNTLCQGQTVTFTATPSVPLGSVQYLWYQNGARIFGAAGNTYTTTAQSVNQLRGISVTAIDTGPCNTSSTASAAAAVLPVVVDPVVTPTVSISVSPGTTVCTGSPATFTATPVNGGSAPGYQWQINGVNVPNATGSTFTTSTLVSGQQVRCILRSDGPCLTINTAPSNIIVMTVSPVMRLNVLITGPTSICQGAAADYLAIAPGPGTLTYQWLKNGQDVTSDITATGPNQYATKELNNGDVVTCQVSTTAACYNGPFTSNPITVTVKPNVIPSVSVAETTTSLVLLPQVRFTATPVNGGSNPQYTWEWNGKPIPGLTGPVYLAGSPPHGVDDRVTVTMTPSSDVCVDPASVCVSVNFIW